jgi:hypothetical protein
VDIIASSLDSAYSLTIHGNSGNITQNNRTTGVIVRDQIFYGGSLILYSLIGSDNDGVVVGWAYCTGQDLTSLFLEATNKAAGFTQSTMRGTCNVKNGAMTSVDLVTKAECISVTKPSAIPTIDGGSELSLHNDTVGNVTLGTEQFNLIPFAIIDCANCSDASHGWVEVHSMLTSKSSADVCFGIFYLFLTCSSVISLQYVQCFLGDYSLQSFTHPAGYDLSNVIKNSTTGYGICAASLSPSKDHSASPEVQVPLFTLAIAVIVGLGFLYS